MNEVRVRFAPSPTGYLHLGLTRTALYNWIFARKNKGKFIVRIEDTDELRSTKESVLSILEGLAWLGLDWDEGPCLSEDFLIKSVGDYGPYFQMQRLEIYRKYAQKLLNEGKLYPCYCSEEELEEKRKRQLLLKMPPRYDRKCRYLTKDDRKKFEGKKFVLRFKVPEEGETSFFDVIRGKITFRNEEIDDFIVMKANMVPTYNFAVVIDDYLMKISHVIRGEDHISNTPKQILLYDALGWQSPVFAHLSMILGPDKKKLSKRHGAVSILEYRDQGYLPSAMRNYLALLGWSTEESQQLFLTTEELIDKFSLERCKPDPAIFDLKKLLWMNGEHLKRMKISDLTNLFIKFSKLKKYDFNYLERAIKLEQEKIKTLKDVEPHIDFFLVEIPNYKIGDVERILKKEGVRDILSDVKQILSENSDFSAKSIERLLREYAAVKKLKTSDVFHPIRVAVSGRMQGPPLFEMLEVLGKERTIARIKFVEEKFYGKG